MLRLFVIAIVTVGVAACQDVAASRPADTGRGPPTQLERSMLGPDADDAYFLARFRSCAEFGSYTYCQAEMYGGLPR
ncbi:MAG: hypothetical protein MUD06_07365 [Rhodospirillales bacterium]|jgi:hypothetical protein|nr:hypothetical protein [Rhodospirillales bacterium]